MNSSRAIALLLCLGFLLVLTGAIRGHLGYVVAGIALWFLASAAGIVLAFRY